MKSKNVLIKRTTTLPLYDFKVKLVVARDIVPVVSSYITIPEGLVYEGLCLARGREVVVIYRLRDMTAGLIAHELFHATHRIMEGISANFSTIHQEPFAYVNEWLHNQVYAQLKKARIRVR